MKILCKYDEEPTTRAGGTLGGDEEVVAQKFLQASKGFNLILILVNINSSDIIREFRIFCNILPDFVLLQSCDNNNKKIKTNWYENRTG